MVLLYSSLFKRALRIGFIEAIFIAECKSHTCSLILFKGNTTHRKDTNIPQKKLTEATIQLV